jgi:hypothetical protein
VNPNLIASYLDNLIRLRLIEIRQNFRWTEEYKRLAHQLLDHPVIVETQKRIRAEDEDVFILHESTVNTPFGRQFLRACVVDFAGV